MYKIVNEKHPGIHDLRPELPKSLDRLLDKALAKDLSERYQNSMEFAYDIRLLMQEIETGQRKTRNNELLPYVEGVSFFQDFTDKQLNEMLSVCNLVKVEKIRLLLSKEE